MASPTWSSLWNSLSDDHLLGWVQNVDSAEAVRKAFEVSKSLYFVSGRKQANFGENIKSESHSLQTC